MKVSSEPNKLPRGASEGDGSTSKIVLLFAPVRALARIWDAVESNSRVRVRAFRLRDQRNGTSVRCGCERHLQQCPANRHPRGALSAAVLDAGLDGAHRDQRGFLAEIHVSSVPEGAAQQGLETGGLDGIKTAGRCIRELLSDNNTAHQVQAQ